VILGVINKCIGFINFSWLIMRFHHISESVKNLVEAQLRGISKLIKIIGGPG